MVHDMNRQDRVQRVINAVKNPERINLGENGAKSEIPGTATAGDARDVNSDYGEPKYVTGGATLPLRRAAPSEATPGRVDVRRRDEPSTGWGRRGRRCRRWGTVSVRAGDHSWFGPLFFLVARSLRTVDG